VENIPLKRQISMLFWRDGGVLLGGGVSLMSIQAVFFDMGGTIETYRWTPELRIQATAGIRTRLAAVGIHFDKTDRQLYETVSAGLDAYHQLSLQTQEELPPQRVWLEYILPDYSVDPAKFTGLAEELMLYIETHYYERAMRPEVPTVLESIQKMGLKIGLISNVNSRGQVTTNLEQYGIRDYFDPLVLSSEYGRRKPDPAIFHHAARLANVPASQCVYIGDRIARDVLGARRAGFHLAVQILHDYEHGEVDEGPVPDATISSLQELEDILRVEMGKDSLRMTTSQAPTPAIQAMIFDAGDVLYHRPNRYQKLAAFLGGHGIDFSAINQDAARALEQQAFRGLIDRDHYREALLRIYGITQPDLIETGKHILDAEDNDIVFFDGVRDTLRALKNKGCLLGIITDTAVPISVKLHWFENGGIGDVWDSIISSKEIGVRKPDPMIYQAALQQLGIPASQVVFVGHKASELEGARNVGMGTVGFNYEQDARADYYIEKFPELLNFGVVSEPVSVYREERHA
jgi:HAD superfamily hydrolase (TIGR01549 family)/HAD superfamily hydrolase (TIGR01509 family)